MTARRLSADWLVPVAGEPIRNGALLIDESGRIAQVGPDADVAAPAHVPTECFTGGVIAPGLINTHTHLELTGLGPVIITEDFPSWIRVLRARKAGRTQEEFDRAAEAGVRQMWATGVTTVADTGDTGAAARALDVLGGRGIAYQEVFGPHPGQVGESLAALEALVGRASVHASERVRIGVSPHAPYTVSEALYRTVAGWARARGLPLALHLAESADEAHLVQEGAGRFASAWGARGIPLPGPARSPVSLVDRSGVLGRDTLCIHMIRVDAEDIGVLRARGVSIAHCPLSNAAHGHGSAPLEAFLEAGLRVGLGTDSELSSAPLELRAEACAVMERTGMSPMAVVRLLTLDGADAIGLARQVGSLEARKQGDVVVFDGSEAHDPLTAVLSAHPICATFIGGEPVFRGVG